MTMNNQSGILDGNLSSTGVLVGYIEPAGALSGSLAATNILVGELVLGGGGDPYRGEYDVIPTFEQQTLLTANKHMMRDLTVEEIPYAEVANPSGGMTITIGG